MARALLITAVLVWVLLVLGVLAYSTRSSQDLRCPPYARMECDPGVRWVDGGIYCGCSCSEDDCWGNPACRPAAEHSESSAGDECDEGQVLVCEWSPGVCGPEPGPLLRGVGAVFSDLVSEKSRWRTH